MSTTPTPDRPAWDSDEQKQWNREHHGERVTMRVPVAFLDDLGDPYACGYRDVEVTLITDPERLGEPHDVGAVWPDDGEQIITTGEL